MTETQRASAAGDRSDAGPSLTPQAQLGAALRSARKAKGLSLSEVAQSARISASFVSLVENGKSDITIGRLARLVALYGISINDLLPAPPPADAHVVRMGEERRLPSPREGIDVLLLTPDTKRTMMPHVVVFEPGAHLAEYGRHEGEEFVHVLEGKLSLELAGSEPRVLSAGDSAYYRADQPHLFRNASSTEALRIICVDSPPNL